MSRRRRPPPPTPGLLSGWTIQRATVAGLGFGLLALLLSAFAETRALLLVYTGLLLLTIACGGSILLISLIDSHARQRGERVRPIRIFDLAMGALLVLPPGFGLYKIWPYLGL
jgi:ABC-type transport system involved in multi-copper enzyme maturation permease subunit